MTTETKASLYALGCAAQDIAGEIAAAAELLDDPETEGMAIGLIETYLQAQDRNRLALLNKADNLCRYIDHLQASATFRADQGKRLVELAKADQRRAEQLKTYMMQVLTALHPTERSFSLPTHELRSRNSTKVEIIDPDQIPDDLFRVKTTREPDKDLLRKALKGDVEIPGARLVTETSWTIK